jgi:choice-of-anchor B domain-containing protein
MKLAPAALLTWLLLSIPLSAQPRVAYHTTLFGTLNPESGGGGRYSAIWGYTAPDGREYALLGGYRGLHIIDITTAPVHEVAFIDGPDNGWREIKTYSHYAYVVSEGGAGLQIVDLANLPASASLVREDTRFFNSGHTISQEGHYVYVNGSNPSAGANGGTIILDVTNPTEPAFVGKWADRYVHDATIRNDTMWAAAIEDGRLDVVYVGDRANPRFVTDIVYPGAGTHNSDVTTDGHYVMTTDEIGSTVKSLKVWDVSDIDNIRKVADFTHDPVEIIHNVHIKGDLAVASWYTAGTRIMDISDPTDPVEVGYYDTFDGVAAAYAGNWGTYPYFPSGKIISSDMQSGLFVFTFDGSRRASVSGVVRDAETGDPIANATVTVASLGRTVTADAQGRYRLAAAPDTLMFVAAGADHFDGTGTFILTPGAGTTFDITLRPIAYASVEVRAVDARNGSPLGGYAWHALTPVGGGVSDGNAATNPATFRVPTGVTTQVEVGAWGYLPKTIELNGTPATIDVPLERGYADDAEMNLGWSLSSPQDDATHGRWERGIPIGTSFNGLFVQPDVDHTADPGHEAFITQIAGTDPSIVGSSDVDSGRTSLTTPPMDLTTYGDPVVNAYLWYSRDLFPSPNSTNDTLVVYLSGNDGQTWQVIDRITSTDNDWMLFRYRVAQFMTPTAAMRLRVEASDLRDQTWVEAGLDDFLVVDAAASSVAAQDGASHARVTVRPNPAHTSAAVDVTLPAGLAGGRLEVFDALGRMVTTLHAGSFAAGTTSYRLDVGTLASGRYTWRLSGEAIVPMTGAIDVVR